MKLVREYIDFERGQDPKKAMGLGLITLPVVFERIIYDEDKWDAGIMEFDLSDKETKETYDDLKKIGLSWEIPFSTADRNPEIIFTGTRDQIAQMIAEVYLGEPIETVQAAMAQWDGTDPDDLWDTLGY